MNKRLFTIISPSSPFHRAAIAIIAALLCGSSARAAERVVPNPQAVAEVRAGRQRLAHAAWWGFDPDDATAALQAAIDSGAAQVVVEDMKSPWNIGPIQLAGDQELLLEKGVVLQAKRGQFQGRGDCLLSASGKNNVRVKGRGATLRMWRDDYAKPPYVKSEWRHALNIRSCSNVRITGVTIAESGGDGIYLGVSQKGKTNRDVEIRDVICDRNYRQGISVISAEGLLIENTVLRATGGTAPMSGIDFEPNDPSEKLINCVMRNCIVEDNAGNGYDFYLKNLNAGSAPISIRLENCRSRGSRFAFRFTTGNGDDGAGVRGSVQAITCQFEDSAQAGISINSKPASGCSMRFEKCRIANVAAKQPNVAPIQFTTAAGNNQNVGGEDFIDCVVVDPLDRRPLSYADAAGGLKLTQVAGVLVVERNGQRTAYSLDQKLLDQWFPFQAFKEFPPFKTDGVRWQPVAPGPRPQRGWSCPVRQRGHAEFMVWAEEGQNINVVLGLGLVGKGAAPRMRVAAIDPSGFSVKLAEMVGEGEKAYSLPGGGTGAYRIVCDPGNSTVKVVSSSHPVGLYAPRGLLHLLGAAGELSFYVPASVSEFALRTSGEGGAEKVKATIYDAAGRQVSQMDNIDAHQFLLSRPAGSGAEIWRVRLEKPSQGIIEDHYLQLQGVPPLLTSTPDALLKPAP